MLANFLPPRYFFAGCVLAFGGTTALAVLGYHPLLWMLALLTGSLSLTLVHLRFLLKSIRPEIRQYLLENDTEEIPYSRVQRTTNDERANNTISANM